MRTCLVFMRGGVRFAVELSYVRRICALREMRALPSPAEGVLGVVPDGNHIVPVIEAPLPAPLLLPIPPRIVLLNNGESPFGFRVEALGGPRVLKFERVRVEILVQNQPLLREVPAEAILGRVNTIDLPADKFRLALKGMELFIETGLDRSGERSGESAILLNPAFLYRTRLLSEEA